jgi:hypothetical protein
VLLIPNGRIGLEEWKLPSPISIPDDLVGARRAQRLSWAMWAPYPLGLIGKLWGGEWHKCRPECAFVLIGFAWDEAGRLLVEKSRQDSQHPLPRTPIPHSEL